MKSDMNKTPETEVITGLVKLRGDIFRIVEEDGESMAEWLDSYTWKRERVTIEDVQGGPLRTSPYGNNWPSLSDLKGALHSSKGAASSGFGYLGSGQSGELL